MRLGGHEREQHHHHRRRRARRADRRHRLRRGPKAEATARLERLADLGVPGWRERVTWRRDGVANRRTGALDLPGTTWRDRPAIDRGDGVWLAGDSVAAPGLLGEVSVNSALAAARAALSELSALSGPSGPSALPAQRRLSRRVA